jgi:branched-chain amino acid transport system permease protein
VEQVLDVLADPEFWIGAGVVAGIYAIFTLGLQLNVGFTGIFNFGQVGFMAVGAYTMGIVTVKLGWPLWLALPAGMVTAALAAALIGLSSLRLRADYLAIATIAFAEIIRYIAQNARPLTGGNQGIFGYHEGWAAAAEGLQEGLSGVGLDYFGMPLLVVTWGAFLVLMLGLLWLQRTPWGRVLRAIREDEDAVAARGKNPFSYKLQSLCIAAILAAIAGYLLALHITILFPTEFEADLTFVGYTILVLGGVARYAGVALGALLLWVVLEMTRFVDLPLAAEKVAAVRFMIVGLVLILLMMFRPQGLLGNREEMVLRE